MLVSPLFCFNDAEIFTDPVFDMNHIVAGLDIGGFIHAFLFFESASVTGMGAAMGVVSIEITFGDDRDLFMGIICAFMDYAEVKLKLIYAGKRCVEFFETDYRFLRFQNRSGICFPFWAC